MKSADVRKAFDKYGSDKGSDHGYEAIYAAITNERRPESILEIGVREGRSIAAWQELFPGIKLTGIDIEKMELIVPETSFEYIEYDSTIPEIKNVITSNYDIIIDDGSHNYVDQIKTFQNLAGKFNHCYIIEDIYTGPTQYAYRQIEEAVRHIGYNDIHKYRSQRGAYEYTYAMIIYN